MRAFAVLCILLTFAITLLIVAGVVELLFMLQTPFPLVVLLSTLVGFGTLMILIVVSVLEFEQRKRELDERRN